jgi:hypothetical protein
MIKCNLHGSAVQKQQETCVQHHPKGPLLLWMTLHLLTDDDELARFAAPQRSTKLKNCNEKIQKIIQKLKIGIPIY